ncbi:MAG TPA: redoxin domain-containing protein, partial [Ilumatobacteraceae bacterium]|nr:redoxin domain-containing protein [Ilumatobacteraceae bacterium]
MSSTIPGRRYCESVVARFAASAGSARAGDRGHHSDPGPRWPFRGAIYPARMPLKPGDKAPDFTLLDQNGEPVSLASFTGRKVLVYFYPKADTPGCTMQACGLRDI